MKINNNEIDDSEPGVRVVKQIDGDIRNGIAIVCADFIYRYICSLSFFILTVFPCFSYPGVLRLQRRQNYRDFRVYRRYKERCMSILSVSRFTVSVFYIPNKIVGGIVCFIIFD